MHFLAQELDTCYCTWRTKISLKNWENKFSSTYFNNPKSKGSNSNSNSSSLTSGSAPNSFNSNSSGSPSNPKPYADKLGKDRHFTQEEKDHCQKNNLFYGNKHKTEDCNKCKAVAFAKGYTAKVGELTPASKDLALSEPEN